MRLAVDIVGGHCCGRELLYNASTHKSPALSYPATASIMTAASKRSRTQTTAVPPIRNDAPWEVLAILAERTSTTLGVNEVLVVCKPAWIPITYVSDGPVLRQHLDARIVGFSSDVGSIHLPVTRNSILDADVQATADRLYVNIQAAREHELALQSGSVKNFSVRGVAKRAARIARRLKT